MKKHFTLFAFLILLSVSGFAQMGFATAGAEWYYSLSAGVAHAYIAADTVVQGKTCRHIKMESGVESAFSTNGFSYYALPDYIVYDAGDTTFVYNTYFNSFTPLYIWNVTVGDTIKLPVIPPSPGYNDTTRSFRFVVDSVKMVLYDTSMLNTVYTTSIPWPGTGKVYNYGAYAEKIGMLNQGLIPFCLGCPIPLDDRIPILQATRCYHDSTYSIKLVTDDCSKGINVGVAEVPNSNLSLSLFPNPTIDGNITIRGSFTDGKIYTIAITDLTGRSVRSQTVKAVNGSVNLSLSTMATDIYILKMWNGETYIGQQKLVVSH